MVAGTGYDACRQDRRHTLAVSPAGRTGNPKSVRCSPGLLADLLFASFGLFAPPNVTSAVTLTLCALAVAGAVGMILELEQGFRRTHPYLAATDAPGRRGVGSPINRRRIAVRQLVLRREFCPIHYPPQSVQGPLSEARLNAHPYTPPVELLRADWILPQLRMLRFDLR